MEFMAVQEFTADERSVDGGYYEISLRNHKGQTVDVIIKPTMSEAYKEFQRLGYKKRLK